MIARNDFEFFCDGPVSPLATFSAVDAVEVHEKQTIIRGAYGHAYFGDDPVYAQRPSFEQRIWQLAQKAKAPVELPAFGTRRKVYTLS